MGCCDLNIKRTQITNLFNSLKKKSNRSASFRKGFVKVIITKNFHNKCYFLGKSLQVDNQLSIFLNSVVHFSSQVVGNSNFTFGLGSCRN